MFKVQGRITNTNNQQALAVLTHLKDTYTTKVDYLIVKGDTKDIYFVINETVYVTMVTTITDLITTYGDGVRLFDWQINYKP